MDQALVLFREQVTELADTLYEGDEREAFRHVAFQQTAPDRTLSDQQVIELTAIDHSGDLEIDGSFDDDTSEEFFLFQSMGGASRVAEGKVAKFWEAPQEILDPERIAKSRNQSVRELSKILDEKLAEDYSLRLVFASRGGFTPSARQFAASKGRIERVITLADGTRKTCSCSLELKDEQDLAQLFDDHRTVSDDANSVGFTIEESMSYPVETDGQKSLRATIRASELVAVFRKPGFGFRLFLLNPRGPIANAKVNQNIKKTLEKSESRKIFHLLNNGLCATCDDFDVVNGVLSAKNFQIVNGCQTTVTLNGCPDEHLSETLIDLKLTIANDSALAERIASASNSQTALRARDHTSFENQQRQLQLAFGELQPPWYYEIKQGYWRYVLNDKDKAKYKTGKRKRHIEVQPLAQSTLAFTGFPADALDRVRYVFQGIKEEGDRQMYERAFPVGIRTEQLLLPWTLLDSVQKQKDREKYSTFHLLWLVAYVLRQHYQLGPTDYFSREMSSRLIEDKDAWFPDVYRVVNTASKIAISRATVIMGEQQFDLRSFFRASGDLTGGVRPLEELRLATDQELRIQTEHHGDPRLALPKG